METQTIIFGMRHEERGVQ